MRHDRFPRAGPPPHRLDWQHGNNGPNGLPAPGQHPRSGRTRRPAARSESTPPARANQRARNRRGSHYRGALGLGFRGHPRRRAQLLPRAADPGPAGCGRRRPGPGGVAKAPQGQRAPGPGVVAHPGLRGDVVRRLQRRAECRRTSAGCRHGGATDQRQPHPRRSDGRNHPEGGLPAVADHRQPGGVRRRRRDRPGLGPAVNRRCGGRAALPARGRPRGGQRHRAETGAAQTPGGPGSASWWARCAACPSAAS